MAIFLGADDSQSEALVSLWWAPLDVSSETLERVTAGVSHEEWRKADQFHRALDRWHFLAARGWLRRLLAHQVRCLPEDLRIASGDHGKPRLVGSELHFNASRSGNVALYATSWATEVGVDVERIRPTIDTDGIAATFFAPSEQRALAALPPEERAAATFRCWTRKEAYLKATGEGLTLPLPSVDVGIDGDRRSLSSGWSVHQVEVADGFAAATAGRDLDASVPGLPRQLS